jgi:hypothetical protein
MTTIQETKHFDELPKVRQATMQTIFRKSFPDQWRSAIPFPKDPVFFVLKDTKPIGFCMVHDACPTAMTGFPQKTPYMYNLCVLPTDRKGGAATQLLDYVTKKYGTVASHMKTTDPYHTWLTKRGWKPVGKWREIFVEYVYTPQVVKQIQPAKENLRHYDPDENVIYLD